MKFLTFMGEHPILTAVLAFLILGIGHDIIVDTIRAGVSCK